MKKVLSIMVLLAILSCKQNTEVDVKTPPSQAVAKEAIVKNSDLNVTGSTTEVTFMNDEATAVHKAYLKLKGALVNTDAASAAAAAKEFTKVLEVNTKSAPMTELQGNLERIVASAEVKEQRIAFEVVSANVESYLTDFIQSGALIKQFCPMAFEGKGAYWLSDSEEIRNPYYGDKMLRCGVIDTLIN